MNEDDQPRIPDEGAQREGPESDATRLPGEPAPADRTEIVAPSDQTASRPPAEEPPPTVPDASSAGAAGTTGSRANASASGAAHRAGTLSKGDVLFGEYEILGILGKGGMGEVYRARHRRLEESRAIKVMRPALATHEAVIELFYREAKALLAIRHPAVVHCHDLLSDDEGVLYLVMELIEGVPLSNRLGEGPMAPSDLSALAARLSAGLAAAHEQGVVHRDLSPDNVILPGGRAGEAKIIDFGIAKVLEAGTGTVLEGFKGKLGYASPEQLGFHGGLVDARSDYYSLGLVLCAAATGRPLEMGQNVVEAVEARRSLQGAPDAVPATLRSNIATLLELDPDNRLSPMDLFADVPPASTLNPADRVTPPEEPARRTELPWWALAGTLGVAALVGAVSIVTTGDGEPPAQAPALARPAETLSSPQTPAAAPARATKPVAPAAEARTAPPARKPAAKTRTASRAESLRQTLKLTGMLRGADTALEEGRLLQPAGASALDRYRAVLAIDPKNREAQRGIDSVLTSVVARAEAALRDGRMTDARNDLTAAQQLAPRDARVANLRRQIASAR